MPVAISRRDEELGASKKLDESDGKACEVREGVMLLVVADGRQCRASRLLAALDVMVHVFCLLFLRLPPLTAATDGRSSTSE